MKSKQLMNGEESQIYTFVFENTQHKLEISSPVEFQGFQVGYITDIENSFSENNKSVQSKIYALLYTSAFKHNHDKNQSSSIETLVQKGLKATLNQALPLVGAEYIDLVFDNQKAQLVKEGEYLRFPTQVKKKTSNILTEVKALIRKLKKLPLEKLLITTTALIEENKQPINKILTDLDTVIVKSQKPIEKILKDLEKIMKNINKTVKDLNQFTQNDDLQQLPQSVNHSLQELEATLAEFQTFAQGYNSNSKFSAELSATLLELSLAAESIGRVSRKLERKPNSLLLGDD